MMKMLDSLSVLYMRLDKKRLWVIWTSNLLWVMLLFYYVCCIDCYAEKQASSWESQVPKIEALNCEGAILIEAETGKVLYEQNADKALPPASVMKIMTLLIVMEALEGGRISWDQMLTASSHAASMGGSQIFLEVGERMSVEDLIKSVVISSANDAAVVLAEAVAGSEEAFVSMMNSRAKELLMHNTHFENTNGLDDTVVDHVTSARDIAIMSRELIKHEKILEYSSIWMDTVREGKFGLTNTNRLVRFYSGATGLKTGSTSKAKFCISATAKRDGMHLIAVILGAPSRDIRNAEAAKLLDWGFANYSVYTYEGGDRGSLQVDSGDKETVDYGAEKLSFVIPKGSAERLTKDIVLTTNLIAPITTGDVLGTVVFMLDGEEIAKADIVANETVSEVTLPGLIIIMLKMLLF